MPTPYGFVVFCFSPRLLGGTVLLPSLSTFSTHWLCWRTAQLHDAPYYWDFALCTTVLPTSSGKHPTSSSYMQSCNGQADWEDSSTWRLAVNTNVFFDPAIVCHHADPSGQTLIPCIREWQGDWKST